MKIIDQKKLADELRVLKDEIKYGRNDPKFLVSSLPAGTCKTTTFIQAMKELHIEGGKRKTLFVQFNKDFGNQNIAMRINNACGQIVAKAVDSSMKPHELNDRSLSNYEVLIITHEMHLSLNSNPTRRAILTDGRDNLVIDEEVNWVKKQSLSRDLIDTFIAELPRGLRSKFEDLIFPVERLLGKAAQLGHNEIVVVRDKEYFTDDYHKYLNDFEKDLAIAIDDEYLSKLNNRVKEKRSKEYFNWMCNTLELMAKNDVVIDRTGVTTYDNSRHPLLLSNNVILDANAGFFTGYQLSKHFNSTDVSGIVDYSDWNFHICSINSSKSSKSRYVNYHDEITGHIVNNLNPSNKVLIVGSKVDREKFSSLLKDGQIEYVHFQRIAGRNDWFDFNRIYVIDTPYFSQKDYVVDTLYYREHLKDRFGLDTADYFVRQARSYAKQRLEAYNDDPDELFEECSDDIGMMYENAYSGMFASLSIKQREDDKIQLNDDVVQVNRGSHGTLVFDDEEIDRYRTTKVAGAIYQATMRIGRVHGSQLQKDVYIINNNKMVLDVLTSRFPAATVKDDFNLNIHSKHKHEKLNLLKPYEQSFIDFVIRYGDGEYAKKQIISAIGLKSANFKNSVMRNEKLKDGVRYFV